MNKVQEVIDECLAKTLGNYGEDNKEIISKFDQIKGDEGTISMTMSCHIDRHLKGDEFNKFVYKVIDHLKDGKLVLIFDENASLEDVFIASNKRFLLVGKDWSKEYEDFDDIKRNLTYEL